MPFRENVSAVPTYAWIVVRRYGPMQSETQIRARQAGQTHNERAERTCSGKGIGSRG